MTDEIKSAAYHEPGIVYEYDEDGPIPCTLSAGWDIAFGCRVSFGWDEQGALSTTVSISDDVQRNGVAKRGITPEQLEVFADQLKVVARAGMTPLQLHLASRHALANAYDVSDAEGREYHDYEHESPGGGTIRDHSPDDLGFDVVRAVAVIHEGREA